MDNLNILLSGFLFASALLYIFISIYSFTANKTSIAVTFALLCLCFSFYSAGYAMELYSEDFMEMLFYNQLQYIGIPFLAPLWLLLSLQYINKYKALALWVRLSIFVIPSATFVLRLTNSLHHLYYTYIGHASYGLFPVLFVGKGLWYYINGLYMTLCILLSAWFYLSKCKKHTGFARKQCLIMLAASLLPWLAFLPSLFSASPGGVDLIPFTGTVSCILFLIVLFRFQFLDLKPLARDKVFESSNDGIIVLDTRYSIIDFNPMAAGIFPALRPDSYNKNIRKVLEDDARALSAILNPAENRYTLVNSGRTYHYNIRCSEIHVKNELVTGLTVTISDVTKHVEAMERLDYLASRDDLTGLYNRRQFFKCGSYELERAKRYRHSLSFIILDIDFFKSINDEYSHQAGDHILKSVSDICLQSLRSVDILGRYGGEEFVVFLPETGLKHALLTAERIRENIESAGVNYENKVIRVTASIGVTGLDNVGSETLEAFLKNADKALYTAKAEGRNCVRSEIRYYASRKNDSE